MVQHAMEDYSHGTLVSQASIFQSEGHHHAIETPNGCSENKLLCIPVCHSNLVIATEPIHEREHGVSSYKIYQ